MDDAGRIADYTAGMTLAEFLTNERTLFAVERLLQRISEAAIQIDPADAAAIGPDLPVARLRGLGNRLRHEYDDIDAATVFGLARVQVPALREVAQRALDQADR